jgi:DNA-binding transcriptional ArsR family regulator
MEMPAAFGALSDPVRLRIVESLADGEHTAGEVAQLFPISRPAVSRHLRVLREAGVVAVREEAQRRVYRLEAEPFVEIDRWLDRYRGFWSERLDALQRYLEEDTR